MGLINRLRRKEPSADSEHIKHMEKEYKERKRREAVEAYKKRRHEAIVAYKKRLAKREHIKKIVFENYYRKHHRTWEDHQFKPKRTKRNRSYNRPKDYDYNTFGMPQPGTYTQPFNPFEPLHHKRSKR